MISRILAWASIAGWLILPAISSGHSPHHVITDVAVATAESSSDDVFILITDQIFRSDEEGSSWKNLVNGLNNQFAFTSLSVSPAYELDHTVFVASAGDGVFRSDDGGESWRRATGGLNSLDVAVLSISENYEEDERLLAASVSGGVWRSLDGAETWSLVLTEHVRIADFAEVPLPGGLPVVFAGDTDGRVWRSDDNGRLWEIVFEFPDGVSITSIAGNAHDVYVGTRERGLYYSSDAGRSFSHVATMDGTHLTSIKLWSDRDNGYTVAVTTWHEGLSVSDDRGTSWSRWNEGLSTDRQADDMSEPHFRELDISQRPGEEPVFWLGAFDGLFRVEGKGSPWRQLETLPLGLIKGMAIADSAGTSPVIALSTYGGGFYISENRGSDWVIGNRGLLTTRLTGLAFSTDFDTDGEIYAGASRRLLRTTDRGRSWQRITLRKTDFGTRVLNKLDSWGVGTSWLRSSNGAATSPVYPTHIVSLPGIHSNRVLFATRFHGVLAFEKESGSIEDVWAGTDQIMNSLTISPEFEQDHTLYSSIRGDGVFRSDDGGEQWIAVNQGLRFVEDWAAHPERGDFRRDAFVAISPDFASDQTLFTGSPAGDGLYMTQDRGESWTRLAITGETFPAPVLAIAVSPNFRIDETLLVSIKGQGLFRSEDRGLSFIPVGVQLITDNASIELMGFSPNYANDHSIVAASDEALFLSEDRGDTWSEIRRPVRYEDMRDVVRYTGDWQQQQGEQYSAMTETTTSSVGDSASLRFVGGGIRWLGSMGPDHGDAEVYIDNELVGTVSCHAAQPEAMQELFVSDGLAFGAHVIEIRLAPNQAPDGSRYIGIDSFDVLPKGLDEN